LYLSTDAQPDIHNASISTRQIIFCLSNILSVLQLIRLFKKYHLARSYIKSHKIPKEMTDDDHS